MKKQGHILVVYDLLIAMFFAGSIAGETLMDYTGAPGGVYPKNFMSTPTLVTFAIAVAVFIAVFLGARWIRRVANRWTLTPTGGGSDAAFEGTCCGALEPFARYVKAHVKVLVGISIVLVGVWSVLLLYFFPGTCMNDQLYCIKNPIKLSSVHPLVLNLLLSNFVSFGRDVLGSANAGFALYVEFQIIICAFVVAICCVWLGYRKVPKIVVLFVLCFFALIPLVSSYSVSAVKDTLFAYVLLLWIPFLFEAIYGPESFWKSRASYAFLGILVIVTSLVRNNGMPLAFAMLLLLVFVSRSRVKLSNYVIASLVAMAVVFVPTAYAQSQGVTHLLRETVGIPLQQMTSVYCGDSVDMPKSCKSVFKGLFPKGRDEVHYKPITVDGVKFHSGFDSEYLQEHQAKFFSAYVRLGLSNPVQYARAYGSTTYGNWSLRAPGYNVQSYFVKINSNNISAVDKVMEEFNLENRPLLPQPICDFLDATYIKLLDVYPNPGLCFSVILLLGYALTLRFRSARPLIVITPLVLLWATLMLTSPLSVALRYVFPMIVAMPILAALLFSAPVCQERSSNA